jgi:hypothetical protein
VGLLVGVSGVAGVYTAAPTSAPMKQVTARAAAPQKTTRVALRQLDRHLPGQGRGEAALLVDARHLGERAIGVVAQLALLAGEVGALGVALRADRHVLARRHRHCTRDEPGDAGRGWWDRVSCVAETPDRGSRLRDTRAFIVLTGIALGGIWGVVMWAITGQESGGRGLAYIAITMGMIGAGVAALFGAYGARKRGERISPRMRKKR